ncbi:MAG: DUF2244 domain-containing protein [Gammaproteobacteria bacterium]|nr:DUF2244 domain-containing protein [Gammaproteobacteria bacterium]
MLAFDPRVSARNQAVATQNPVSVPPSEVIFEATIRPNRSMSARQLAVFVICFAVLSLAIALSLFSIGLWLVLPFAGLEILAVGVAIGYSMRRSAGYEWIVVTDREVSVQKSEFGRSQSYNFQRYWTQVRLERGPSRLRPGRLLIGSHGRFIEIGREFVDEDREIFAARLTGAIRDGRRDGFNDSKASEA